MGGAVRDRALLHVPPRLFTPQGLAVDLKELGLDGLEFQAGLDELSFQHLVDPFDS